MYNIDYNKSLSNCQNERIMSLIKVSELTKPQRSVVESVPRGLKYVEGSAGTGKTTIGVRRMLRLLTKDKVFANEILVVVPQRALGRPYVDARDDYALEAGGRVTVTTMNSLARRMVSLFFPLIAEDMGFSRPDIRPTFLTLETAQYYMSRVVGQFVDERAYFASVSVPRGRLFSQIIDNLNKAAAVGYPHTETADRLKSAWIGDDPMQPLIYEQAQECAELFRTFCLDHNLMDFSLQMESFYRLWNIPPARAFLVDKYRHLILDNIEEDTPIAHDILLDWLQDAQSGLMIQDTEAGYRRFLGAAATSANRFSDLVTTKRDRFTFTDADSFVTSPVIRAAGGALAISLSQEPNTDPHEDDPTAAFAYDVPRFYTEMIRHVVSGVAKQVHEEQVDPNEIVIISPFLTDSLRYMLMQSLEEADVPVRSHRPSRALREEPAVRTLITWAQLAHPNWHLIPSNEEFAHALMFSIVGLDWTRAKLFAAKLYNPKTGEVRSFDEQPDDIKTRLTYQFGVQVEQLRRWLHDYHEDNPQEEIDLFWSRLFGEVLSLEGYGFHDDPAAAENVANLIDSAHKFRRAVEAAPPDEKPIAQEYVMMVRDGIIADQYLRGWLFDDNEEQAVLVAPAYTFLMSNRPVDYQYWLNVASPSWWERLYQPLTHPYVLTREWPIDRKWTDEDEFYTRRETLYRLAWGLMRRCRKGIYLGFSELGEQGREQRGPLLEAIQQIFVRAAQTNTSEDDNA